MQGGRARERERERRRASGDGKGLEERASARANERRREKGNDQDNKSPLPALIAPCFVCIFTLSARDRQPSAPSRLAGRRHLDQPLPRRPRLSHPRQPPLPGVRRTALAHVRRSAVRRVAGRKPSAHNRMRARGRVAQHVRCASGAMGSRPDSGREENQAHVQVGHCCGYPEA